MEQTYAQRQRAAYMVRVNKLPRKPTILCCPNGHEWATWYTDQTDDTYMHFGRPWCPVCDEYWTWGHAPTSTEEATPCTQ